MGFLRFLGRRIVWLVLLSVVVGVAGLGRGTTLNRLYDRLRHGEPAASSSELRPDANGVLFRAGGHDGRWEGNWHVSLQADGRVVYVTDTSTTATPDDYRTWVATPRGRDRLLAEVRREIERHVPHRDPEQTVGYGEGRVANIGDRLVALLRDPHWLGADLASPPAPWVPEHLTVYASRPPRTTMPAKRWPYAVGIARRNDGTVLHLGSERRTLLCLDGAEVGPLFQKMRGVNTAHMLVDDGQRWELSIDAWLPGYRLYGDPCPPA